MLQKRLIVHHNLFMYEALQHVHICMQWKSSIPKHSPRNVWYVDRSSHLLLRHRILVIAEIHYKCLDILGVFTRGIIIWTFNSNFYQLQMAIHDFRIPCITLTLLDDQMHIRKWGVLFLCSLHIFIILEPFSNNLYILGYLRCWRGIAVLRLRQKVSCLGFRSTANRWACFPLLQFKWEQYILWGTIITTTPFK